MAWDDTKVANDDFLSIDWNDMVTDQKNRGYVNAQENKTGADCSGSDGASSRVLTLSNTSLTQDGGTFVYVNGLFQHSSDVTLSHAASGTTVTFTERLWDTDKIAVIYLT